MPPTPQPAAAGSKVSPAGYWIGGGILVVGCGIAVIWFIVAIVGLVNAPDDFERIRVPGSEVVTLGNGDWIIYYESDSSRSYANNPPSVDVTGPNGRAINVQYSSDKSSYSVGSNDGQALYEFHVVSPGEYTIEASTVGEPARRSGDQIAIGRPLFDGGRVAGILGPIALGAVSFLIGLIVLIITIVRRSRSRRRPAYAGYQPPYGGGPPAGGPYYGGPPPGPAGWAPPARSSAPGSSPWPAPGATPPSPDEPSTPPSPPPPAPSPWSAPDDRPPPG